MSGIKVIKFDLPINGIKARTLDELRDNLSDELVALARSGQLGRWLVSRKLDASAQTVAAAVAAELDDKALFLALCRVLEVEVHPDDVAALFDAPLQAGRPLVRGDKESEPAVSRDAIRDIFKDLIQVNSGVINKLFNKPGFSNKNDSDYLCEIISRIESRAFLREIFENLLESIFEGCIFGKIFILDGSFYSADFSCLPGVVSRFDYLVGGEERKYFLCSNQFISEPNIKIEKFDFLKRGELIASTESKNFSSPVSGRIRSIWINGLFLAVLIDLDTVDV